MESIGKVVSEQKEKHIVIVESLNELDYLRQDLMELKRHIENAPSKEECTADPVALPSLVEFMDTTSNVVSDKITDCREIICSIEKLLF